MSSKHLTPEEIQSYIQFALSDYENECVIDHLSECDTCLALVDEEWKESSPVDPGLPAAKLEKRLMSSIHRSNLSGNLMALGFGGFFNVIVGVLAPVLHPRSKPLSRKKK